MVKTQVPFLEVGHFQVVLIKYEDASDIMGERKER